MIKAVAIFVSICIAFTSFCYCGYVAVAEEDPYKLEYEMLLEPTQQELYEDTIYNEVSSVLEDEYLIDVQSFYESKEAIEEGLYNSKETEYFGFLLSEVDAQFQGIPYIFTMDEKGETVVREFIPYEDAWQNVLANIAIGTGVIVVCITVSSLTVASAPAVHLIFSFAADYAVSYGIKGAAVMAIKSAVAKYFETGDIEESLRSVFLEASEGYKWGVIGGAITGAVAKSINLVGLQRASNMSLNDIAKIQMNGAFSDSTIKYIHSTKEFSVYQNAGLIEYTYNGRTFLIPKDLNWDFIDPNTNLTNRQLVEKGFNPVDQFGKKYELHHVGQKKNSPLALLTSEQHEKNTSTLHHKRQSEVHDGFWKKDKKAALESLAQLLNQIL